MDDNVKRQKCKIMFKVHRMSKTSSKQMLSIMPKMKTHMQHVQKMLLIQC